MHRSEDRRRPLEACRDGAGAHLGLRRGALARRRVNATHREAAPDSKVYEARERGSRLEANAFQADAARASPGTEAAP
jgi:hypothetical protein